MTFHLWHLCVAGGVAVLFTGVCIGAVLLSSRISNMADDSGEGIGL